MKTEIITEIFKTNIENKQSAEVIQNNLLDLFPKSNINFDLEDCDRILRVEGEDFTVNKIIEIVNKLGYECEILE